MPIPESLYGQFDTVIDGGTLEHVFHIPNALTRVARLLRLGRYYLGLSIANNWLDHGFVN